MRAAAGLLFALTLLTAAPTCQSGWTQHGPARAYTADNLFEYMDGNSEGYLLYGFQTMQGITCEKAGVTLIVDISDFGDPESAYGMFSSTRDPRLPSTKIGMGGQIVPRRAIFAKGKYYVEIAANPEGDYSAVLQNWADALASTLEGRTDPPPEVACFPAENQQSLRLVPESVLGIHLLKRGYAAEYPSGKAFLVAEDSDAAAAALMRDLRAHFGQTAPVSVAAEAFSANDPYLGRLCIFRKGRYVAGYANIAEGQDAAALSTAFAARIP